MVRGVAYSLEELHGVNLISQVAPFHVIVDVRLANERPLRKALMRINHELWRAGFLDARAVVVGGRVQLTGRFASSGWRSGCCPSGPQCSQEGPHQAAGFDEVSRTARVGA